MIRKVLVISNNSFSKIDNNGKTIESIFIEKDINHISQIYFTERFKPDFDFCKKYFRILDFDVFRGYFLRKKNVGGALEEHRYSNISNISSSITTESLKRNFINSFLRICRDVLWSTGRWKTEDLKNWCSKQEPDFIFFVAGSGKFSHQIAIYLSELLNVKLVTFFTDDYLIYPKKRNLFDFIQYYRMKKFYKDTIFKSSLCFAISTDMCHTYSQFFKKSFSPIMNSIDIREYYIKPKASEVRINYFGSIHTNRWKIIVKLARILKLFNEKNVIISVFVATKPAKRVLKAFADSEVNYMGGIFGDKLQQAILQSDILLHVESDDVYSLSRTKLSISTKIPEYLISGRPILGFGPKEIASMKLLLENEIGIVISPSDNLESIQKQLEKLILDSSFRENLGKQGYDYAKINFDNKTIVKDFNNKIERMFAESSNAK